MFNDTTTNATSNDNMKVETPMCSSPRSRRASGVRVHGCCNIRPVRLLRVWVSGV